MDFLLLLRRMFIVSCIVGLGAGAIVYVGNDWVHGTLLPRVGISHYLGDALGTLGIVLVAFFCQRTLSVGFYSDWLFGLGRLL